LNKKTRALTEEQYVNIIKTLQTGFVRKDGRVVKPNKRVATVLVLEANLGLRLFDVLCLKLESIVKDGNRYRLDIVEQKTQKKRTFTVPIEIYSYIQAYALENNIGPKARLFPITRRTVQHYLSKVCEFLGYDWIGTHSFRKYFATDVYVNNNYNIELVRTLLQHSSVVTTQRYIGIQSEQVESALQKHVKLL
jgi:integrase